MSHNRSNSVEFQMLLLICSFLIISSFFMTDISGSNPFKDYEDPDLPEDFFRKWEDSQVFIYYKRGITKKFLSEFPYPDCFGNLITADYVITATSCFIDLKKLVKRLRGREIDAFYSSDISKITIAKVYVLYLMLITHESSIVLSYNTHLKDAP